MTTSALNANAAHVNTPAASCPLASSSTATLQPRKAVMLKGPSLTSKTYFVPLPDTLDQLVAKAVQLFPVPPGKVPHITLGTDERAIILEESYDFIRDRELLHFRWSAETPRRNLANRVRWVQPTGSASTIPFPLNSTASLQDSSSEGSLTPSVASVSDAPKVQLQASPTSRPDLASTTRANTIANRDPNTQFGEGVAARKAHVQRVLAEQQRKRVEEHTADALGAPPVIADVEQDVVVDVDPEATAKAALELAATSSALDNAQEAVTRAKTDQEATVSTQDADVSTVDDSDSHTETVIATLVSDSCPGLTEVAGQEALLAPAAVSLNIESPPRKKHIDNPGLDTPPSSGSRSSSPFHGSDRSLGGTRPLDHHMHANRGDEPSSSPISSPTRDVSSRYRNALSTAPLTELGHIPSATSTEPKPLPQEEGKEEQVSNDAAISEFATGTIDSASAQTEVSSFSSNEDGDVSQAEAASLSNSPTTLTVIVKAGDSRTSDREINRIYSFLSNLVSQLLSHKANRAFQRPMSVEFEQFSSRSSRPIDLFTIRDSLASRKYGSQHLEGRMAANAVVTDFEDDLTLLYTNARRFFGIRSTQAECVEHLEKFSRSFLNEWKRTQGSAAQVKAVSQVSSDAMARTALYQSPGSRSEKRPTSLSSSPFAMLLTPGSSAASAGAVGSAGNKTVGVNQPPNSSMGLMRRPDFGFKRNSSYEGTLPAQKRPVQATRTTSEAFERALRAATATPQAERIKPRQEVVAPFTTRSVIETDFMARPPPQQQQMDTSPTSAPHTPTTAGRKRKLTDATLGNDSNGAHESVSRSPSLSPPPSPSPTKRTRPVVTPKQSKSAARRFNKKRAKQAAAAAAAAAAAMELTEQKRGQNTSGESDEEQRVLDLLSTSPITKRAGTALPSSKAINEEVSTPEIKGKAKRKKSTSPTRTETFDHDLPLAPSTPSGRMLRPRRTSTEPQSVVPPPKTPPRSPKKSSTAEATVEATTATLESMEVDGFEVTGSRRRSSRPRKPVNLE